MTPDEITAAAAVEWVRDAMAKPSPVEEAVAAMERRIQVWVDFRCRHGLSIFLFEDEPARSLATHLVANDPRWSR